MLNRQHIEPSVQTFLRSLIKILLTVLLIISVIGALGVNTTSFAALLASAGVAIGMALSGTSPADWSSCSSNLIALATGSKRKGCKER